MMVWAMFIVIMLGTLIHQYTDGWNQTNSILVGIMYILVRIYDQKEDKNA